MRGTYEFVCLINEILHWQGNVHILCDHIDETLMPLHKLLCPEWSAQKWYQLSVAGGTRSPPASPAKSKMLLGGQLSINQVLIQALLLWEKLSTDEKKRGGKKIISEIVATNVIASWPSICWQTGTPTAHANTWRVDIDKGGLSFILFILSIIWNLAVLCTNYWS